MIGDVLFDPLFQIVKFSWYLSTFFITLKTKKKNTIFLVLFSNINQNFTCNKKVFSYGLKMEFYGKKYKKSQLFNLQR